MVLVTSPWPPDARAFKGSGLVSPAGLNLLSGDPGEATFLLDSDAAVASSAMWADEMALTVAEDAVYD